jgi:hypothetical protein
LQPFRGAPPLADAHDHRHELPLEDRIMAQAVYRVIQGCPAGELERRLNEASADGWELRELFPSGAAGQAGYDVVLMRRQESGSTAGFHAGLG